MGIILLDLPLMLLGENGQIKKYQILLIALIKVARRKMMKSFFTILIPSVLGFFMTFALSIFFDFILFLYFLKIKNIDFKLTINYQETFVFSLKIMALIFLTSLLYVLVLKEKAVD